jgi:hypothetical protein
MVERRYDQTAGVPLFVKDAKEDYATCLAYANQEIELLSYVENVHSVHNSPLINNVIATSATT